MKESLIISKCDRRFTSLEVRGVKSRFYVLAAANALRQWCLFRGQSLRCFLTSPRKLVGVLCVRHA
jgi:hypothetical protein